MQDARIAIGEETVERVIDPEIEPTTAEAASNTVVSPSPKRWRWPALLTLAFLSGGAIVWSTAERTLGELKARLAEAQTHRTASDAIRSELLTELASQRQVAEAAERKASELAAELASKRAEADTRPTPDPTPAPPQTAEPAPASEPSPAAVAFAPPQFSAVVVPERSAETADSALAVGRRHLQAGNLQAARQSFERAADLGLPEGALAMGTTFDPLTLAKAGIADKGAPHEAQRWYRRAYELSAKPSQ